MQKNGMLHLINQLINILDAFDEEPRVHFPYVRDDLQAGNIKTVLKKSFEGAMRLIQSFVLLMAENSDGKTGTILMWSDWYLVKKMVFSKF